MNTRKWVSFLFGFLALFFIYHFPEFYTEFWITATFKIGFLAAAFLIALLQGWRGLGGYGLSFKRKWKKPLLIGILTGSGFFVLYFIISVLLGFQEVVSISTFDSVLKNLPLVLLMTAIPSIAEDILTRGYLFAHFRKIMTPFYWVLLSSVIYVLNHIWRLNDGVAVWSYLFLLGLVLAYSVLMVRSLWLAFGIHWGANIAFELINSSVEVNSAVNAAADTYVLAGAWGLLLGILLLFSLLKSKGTLLKLKGSFYPG